MAMIKIECTTLNGLNMTGTPNIRVQSDESEVIGWAITSALDGMADRIAAGQRSLYRLPDVYEAGRKISNQTWEAASEGEPPMDFHLDFRAAGIVLAGLWTFIDTISDPGYQPEEHELAPAPENLEIIQEVAGQLEAALSPLAHIQTPEPSNQLWMPGKFRSHISVGVPVVQFRN